MKSVLGFFAALALGLFVAIVVSTSLTSPMVQMALGNESVARFRLDYPSLLLGLALGLTIATLARVGWADLPKRVVNWFAENAFNFVWLALAVGCVAVLLLY